jgi:hypothetical protein
MKSILIFILICIPLPFLGSQDIKVIRDFRTITEAGIGKEFFNTWKIEAAGCLKLEKNSTRVDEVNLDLKMFYAPLKFVTVGGGYRLTANQNKQDIYERKHRYSLEIELGKKIDCFIVDFRIRYQNMDDEFFRNEINSVAEKNILRNRLQIKYNIRKNRLTPYVYTELYGQLATDGPFAVSIRSVIGGQYSSGKQGNLKTYLRIDRELNRENPFTYYNLGIGYVYLF